MATTSIDKIKVWLFPTLVSIVSILIWQEIKEIKSDVKALLAQSNQDKVRIDNLERQVYGTTEYPSTPSQSLPNKPVVYYRQEFITVKEEELYKVKSLLL